MTLLSVEGLHAHYGKSHVLRGVSFDLAPAEMIALLGRNGSGRSTTMKAIMGMVPVTGGSIRLLDANLAGQPPHRINRAGIAYVPEERLPFDLLTVEENLIAGLSAARTGQLAWTIEEMYDYFPRLCERRSTKAGSLSGGEQQMLTLCRSLLGQPRVILIDEPTEGLAPQIVEHMVDVICDINRRGVAVVLVEQKMTIAKRICARSLVMGHGAIAFDGPTEALVDDASIRRQWLEVA
ncbi:MAG: ABC transporter ATP-binding protein [Betaproteobacteria bacterium]|nr:ABC transporter ATP-binding protein [Betaproteobacteria bacterium]